MKKLYIIVLAAILFHSSGSATIIKTSYSGLWNNPFTWDLMRLPQVGDTIHITSGKTVTIILDYNIPGFAYLKVFGNLNFINNSTTLSLGNTSSIYVYPFGTITGGGTNSQKIRIGTQQVFKGNDDPIIGPQMANSTTSDFDPFIWDPLPVKFVGFTLTKSTNKILIQWSTAEELNSYEYEVERSADGSHWNTIAHVAAMGTTQNLNHYSYNDLNTNAKVVYYRIRQVDLDGKFIYTSIKSIGNEIPSTVAIEISSVQSQVLLQFSKEVKGSIIVRFISPNGQVMEQQVLSHAIGQVLLRTKAKGNYYVSVSNGLDVNVAKQILL